MIRFRAGTKKVKEILDSLDLSETMEFSDRTEIGANRESVRTIVLKLAVSDPPKPETEPPTNPVGVNGHHLLCCCSQCTQIRADITPLQIAQILDKLSADGYSLH